MAVELLFFDTHKEELKEYEDSIDCYECHELCIEEVFFRKINEKMRAFIPCCHGTPVEINIERVKKNRDKSIDMRLWGSKKVK